MEEELYEYMLHLGSDEARRREGWRAYQNYEREKGLRDTRAQQIVSNRRLERFGGRRKKKGTKKRKTKKKLHKTKRRYSKKRRM